MHAAESARPARRSSDVPARRRRTEEPAHDRFTCHGHERSIYPGDKLAVKRTRTRAGKLTRAEGINLGIDRGSLVNSRRMIINHRRRL
jgi:hypothetical protein